MAILTLATLRYGSQLLADVTVVGSYLDEHPTRKRDLERPIYDVNRLFIRDAGIVAKDRKTSGVVRARCGGGVLSQAGRLFEYRDDKANLKEYTLTTTERLALRSLTKSGLPADMQIQWDRLARGPMSPTLEQQVGRFTASNADGGTITITNPTSGNLLVICHGYYWRTATPGEPTATGASSTTFTRRGYAGTANFEVLQAVLDRVANGAEGTSITVTNGGEAQDNSSYFLEYAGMAASPFVAVSSGADGSTIDVTSVGTGDVDTDTPNKPDCLLIATFGHDGSPTSFGYTNSFVEEGFVSTGVGSSSHGTRVATRVVSAESATYNTTASWTTGVVASGIVAAYEIDVADPPVNTVPVDTLGIFMTSDSATQISSVSPMTAISVVDAAGLTTCRVYCTNGDLTVTLSGSVVISAGANGSSDLTLGSGASTAEFNTVLATMTYQGHTDFHGADTINVVSTGTGGSDTDTFDVINDTRSLLLTASVANFASLVTATATTEMRMDAGRQSATCTVTATDDTAATDVQVVTLQIAPVETVFPFRNLAVPTARRDRR